MIGITMNIITVSTFVVIMTAMHIMHRREMKRMEVKIREKQIELDRIRTTWSP